MVGQIVGHRSRLVTHACPLQPSDKNFQNKQSLLGRGQHVTLGSLLFSRRVVDQEWGLLPSPALYCC